MHIQKGLYLPQFEKENCGFGLIANMDGIASHWLLSTAIKSLSRLAHRGAIAADGQTGDGCGLLMKMPTGYMRMEAEKAGIALNDLFAVGTVFLSNDSKQAAEEKKVLEQALCNENLKPVGWRTVPIDKSACGEIALQSMPHIEHIFVNAPAKLNQKHFEIRLFVARRRAEIKLMQASSQFHVASLSSRTLSYKGLMMPDSLPSFYTDLNHPDMETSICVFHQRFSTNTLPQWYLAQPFRFLAHNGEINTIQGNRNWTQARTHIMACDELPALTELAPLVSLDASDSYSLDNMLELLLMGDNMTEDNDIVRAARMLMPAAWQNATHLHPNLRAFYEFTSLFMESWDGPAGIVLTDGRYASCIMDKNGLRPARYVITKDRHITLASEIGVYDYQPQDVTIKGRLKPGEMIIVDTATGELLLSPDIDLQIINKWHFNTALNRLLVPLEHDKISIPEEDLIAANMTPVYEKMFGVTAEEKEQVIQVLADAGQEAVGSMGDDTPLPILSSQIRSLFDNFRQYFAQVTNPPIDSLREQVVMSLRTCLGHEANPLGKKFPHRKITIINSPVLSAEKFYAILNLSSSDLQHKLFDLNILLKSELSVAIKKLCAAAIDAVRDEDVTILVLSDRNISKDKYPIHALLACGAIHHALSKEGLRCKANIIVETAVARDPHHFATLIAYGATAIYPYFSYHLLSEMCKTGEQSADNDETTLKTNYRNGINKGVFKIMSKIGISTIKSYRSAQLFEIIGLHDEIVSLCFSGSVSRLQGMGFEDLQNNQMQLATNAWNPNVSIPQGGLLKYIHNGEYHAYNPEIIYSLHTAVRSGNYDDYKIFSDYVNQRPAITFRDLLELKSQTGPCGIDEVEPAETILPRFDSAGMSLGALSPEAHETLAEAMNQLGGRSNSGEGGEDPARYGTNKSSKIKQVASGRFGVTPHYLMNAEVIQIKIAQGAKPGEGGQLPGHKVNTMIAKLRYANEGVSLISPPPHHDIYSIEDLAQLIFDLKQINPKVLVSVKLVAAAGVGTIATGVAKAYADLITISGYDGGTGASPLTSIKYTGGPWELGLPETHLCLRANDLRDKVRLQTDGGLKTGLDVVKAAILGAESFGFGTAPMVAMGCKYLRICHLNSCATGVATQNNILRMKHFIGKSEMVVNYFRFVAQEVRELMAQLGIRKFEDLIGRIDLLKPIKNMSKIQRKIDLSPILSDHGVPKTKPQFCTYPQNKPFDKAELAERMVADMLPAIDNKQGGIFHYEINNTHRSIGARISGEIAKRYGNYGMDKNPLRIHFTGTAGQSFGVWNVGGLLLHLEGDANDYVGKGMAAGEIVIHPPAVLQAKSKQMPIVGNTCLYGATGGKFFASGIGGERFAVRNSGTIAVIEGIGDHGCEYMTGGVVVVLGQSGINFGAGMTGGFAYVLDQENTFHDFYNDNLVDIYRIDNESISTQREYLISLITEHVKKTDSVWGQTILDNFSAYLPLFWLIKPKASELKSLISDLRTAA